MLWVRLCISYLEVSLVLLRAGLPPPVSAVQLVSAHRLQELGAHDDIVVVWRLLRLVGAGGRQLRRLKRRHVCHRQRHEGRRLTSRPRSRLRLVSCVLLLVL